MLPKRIQLTLFVDEKAAAVIEAVRRQYNPVQYALIKSHVTLLRDEELFDPAQVTGRLEQLQHARITLRFGQPVRFSEGNGVLLPAVGDQEPYHRLRASILAGMIEHPGRPEPHITLMHPRNASCTDVAFAAIERHRFPQRIEFRKISLIEQEAGRPWRVVREFELQG